MREAPLRKILHERFAKAESSKVGAATSGEEISLARDESREEGPANFAPDARLAPDAAIAARRKISV